MKFKQYTLLVALTMGFVTLCFSQHKTYAIKNGFGIQGGITQFDIITDNFETVTSNGWIGGMSATVDIPHKWYNMSYNIQFSENYVEIFGGTVASVPGIETIEYKMFTAQIALLMHVKIIKSFLTIDLGPMLQYNSELELKNEDQENYFINNYDALLAKDIVDISKFNVNGAIGVSAGISHFRLKAQYIYGFTNILNKLNDQNLDVGTNTKKFSGNQSMLALTAMVTF